VLAASHAQADEIKGVLMTWGRGKDQLYQPGEL